MRLYYPVWFRLGRLRSIGSWHCCPAAVLDDQPSVPSRGLLELRQFYWRIDLRIEFLDTDRCEHVNRHFAGSKMPKEGSKMPKETFFTAISRWRVVSRAALVSDQPIPASTGIWCRQEMACSGKPCRQSANLAPVPCSSTSKRSPLASTNLVCISGIQHIDLIRQYRGAGIDLLINGDRNDIETRVL